MTGEIQEETERLKEIPVLPASGQSVKESPVRVLRGAAEHEVLEGVRQTLVIVTLGQNGDCGSTERPFNVTEHDFQATGLMDEGLDKSLAVALKKKEGKKEKKKIKEEERLQRET